MFCLSCKKGRKKRDTPVVDHSRSLFRSNTAASRHGQETTSAKRTGSVRRVGGARVGARNGLEAGTIRPSPFTRGNPAPRQRLPEGQSCLTATPCPALGGIAPFALGRMVSRVKLTHGGTAVAPTLSGLYQSRRCPHSWHRDSFKSAFKAITSLPEFRVARIVARSGVSLLSRGRAASRNHYGDYALDNTSEQPVSTPWKSLLPVAFGRCLLRARLLPSPGRRGRLKRTPHDEVEVLSGHPQFVLCCFPAHLQTSFRWPISRITTISPRTQYKMR